MTLQQALKNNLLSARHYLDIVINNDTYINNLVTVSQACVDTFNQKGKILICGNGGSSSDAAHFAEELVGRYHKNRDPLPALALSEPGVLTCIANDYSYSKIFSRQVEAFANTNDIFIGLSTSGRSENIIEAFHKAKDLGLYTVLFLGKDGGDLKGRADTEFLIPGNHTDRIQEIHMLLLHMLVQSIERQLFPQLYENT